MSGGAKFGLGVLFLWLAMVCFYFAFHPNGVSGVTNPSSALKWLIQEFQSATGQSTPASAGAMGASDVGATPNNSNAAPTQTGA